MVALRGNDFSEEAEAMGAIQQLQIVEQAALLYHAVHGVYPADRNPGIAPAELKSELKSVDFSKPVLGGKLDWNGPGTSVPFLGVSILYSSTNVPTAQLRKIDAMLDDDDLSSGYVRVIALGGNRFFQLCLQPN